MNQAERDIQRKLRILKHAEEMGHIARTCRYFGVGAHGSTKSFVKIAVHVFYERPTFAV